MAHWTKDYLGHRGSETLIQSLRVWFETSSRGVFLQRPEILCRQTSFLLIYRGPVVSLVAANDSVRFDIALEGAAGEGRISLSRWSEHDLTPSAFPEGAGPTTIDDFAEAWFRSFERRLAPVLRAVSADELSSLVAAAGGFDPNPRAADFVLTLRPLQVLRPGGLPDKIDRGVKAVVDPLLGSEGFELIEDGSWSENRKHRGADRRYDGFRRLWARGNQLLGYELFRTEPEDQGDEPSHEVLVLCAGASRPGAFHPYWELPQVGRVAFPEEPSPRQVSLRLAEAADLVRRRLADAASPQKL